MENIRLEYILQCISEGKPVTFTPKSKLEAYLLAMANKTGVVGLPQPKSKMEELLYGIASNPQGGTGSGTNTTDATATANEIRKGFTAYVSSGKVEGAIEDYDGSFEGGVNLYLQEDQILEGVTTEYSNSRITKITNYRNGITSIDLPNVVEVGMNALASLTQLKNVNLPNAEIIGEKAFYYYYGTSINLPKAKNIGNNAFQYSKLETINLPNAETIGDYGISGCNSLTNLSLPKVNKIGSNAFNNNQYLINVELLELKVLEYAAFSSCYRLETVILPLVTELKTTVFQKCYSLKKLVLGANKVVIMREAQMLSNCYHFTGTVNSTYNPNGDKDGYIYVPDSLVDSYKSATNWSAYASQIKPLSELEE